MGRIFILSILVATVCGGPVPQIFGRAGDADVSKSYAAATDQLFQIVRGLISGQQNFESSVTAQLDEIKSFQNQFESRLSSDVGKVQNLERMVGSMKEEMGLRQSSGEFYQNKFTLYQGLLHGNAWDFQLPTNQVTCNNIPSEALHKVSSIETNGNCVILFKGRNCAGKGIRFQEYSYGYDDFGRISFHDQATSYRSC